MYLWIVPVMILLYVLYYRYRRTQSAKIGEFALLQKLIEGWQPNISNLKAALFITAAGLSILALANPQWGNKKEKIKAQSSDVFIALDISQSMLAEDISPNRLERAKKLCQNIVKGLKGNRIGLIIFAGNAYLQMPLTNDYAAAELFISSANTNQATTQGTAIAEAVKLAERAYQGEKANQRALIIVTDGEDHDEEAISAIEEAHANGLFVYTIGVGTTEGAVIPYKAQGQELLKRDENGNTVTTKLNPVLIKDMASVGGGDSWLIGQGAEILTSLRRKIELLAKEEVETRSFTDYASYFQYLIAFSMFLWIIEFLIPDKKKHHVVTE
jgi:Ca-activated chloride channel family protein